MNTLFIKTATLNKETQMNGECVNVNGADEGCCRSAVQEHVPPVLGLHKTITVPLFHLILSFV